MYEAMVQEAYKLINEMPQGKIWYVIQILQNMKNSYDDEIQSASINADAKWISNILNLNKAVVVPPTADRGWTRDELYDRGM